MLLSEVAARDMDSTNGRIAAYLLEHLDEVKRDSIRELASRMHESASSISRFCRDIGLRDFNEMKTLLAEASPQFEVCSGAARPEQQKNDYVDAVQDGLERVRRSLDMKKVYQLAEDIRRYPRVAIFGPLKAETAAMSLQVDLAMLGKQSTTKVRFAQQIEYLSHADENDLVILFGFAGVSFNCDIPEGYRQNRKKCPKVYVITSAARLSRPELFDEVICFESLQDQASHPFQLQLVSGMIAQSYAHLLNEKPQNQEAAER